MARERAGGNARNAKIGAKHSCRQKNYRIKSLASAPGTCWRSRLSDQSRNQCNSSVFKPSHGRSVTCNHWQASMVRTKKSSPRFQLFRSYKILLLTLQDQTSRASANICLILFQEFPTQWHFNARDCVVTIVVSFSKHTPF